MTQQAGYGTTAKAFHWTIVLLLIVQYLVGWLMPDIRRDMKPGDAMTLHISVGITILSLMTARLIWRLGHPVLPERSLPDWQRVTSEGVHWLLYALVLATTMTGWYFASFRGWSISLFFAVPLPMLAAEGSQTARSIGHLHQLLEWALLVVIGIHVAAAIAHVVIYRDKILQRMLPG
jgi:cytochrome b561